MKESMLTPETNMAVFQSSPDSVSKQIQTLQNELKANLKTFKDDITPQMRDELIEFKEDIDKKFAKIITAIGNQKEKINAAWTQRKEIESRSYKIKCKLVRTSYTFMVTS